MRPVAKRLSLRALAAAPGNRAGDGDFRFHRREGGPFMRAIAKRLGFGLSTGAPEIGTGFNFLDVRLFLRSSWLAHAYFLARGGNCGNNFNDLF